MDLHPAWACHGCGKLSVKIMLTACGCPYHIDCMPYKCLLHGNLTEAPQEQTVPCIQLLSRRELLRDIQASGLKGLRVEKLLLKASLSDLNHLSDKGLIFFSPHQTAVFDARSVCPAKDT